MHQETSVAGSVINASAGTGTLMMVKSNSTSSPRTLGNQRQGKVMRPGSAASFTEDPTIITIKASEKVGFRKTSVKANKAADGRYGSRGGGDSVLRLPLECMSKKEVRAELRKSKLLPEFRYLNDEDDDEVEEEKEDMIEADITTDTLTGSDKARFNIWKGVNYDLHMLGDFKSDFERRVKSFQKPDMEEILLDPFCRSESGLVEEAPNGKAFLVWRSKSDRWDPKKALAESGSDSFYPVLLTSSSSSGDEGEESDTDSIPDPDIKEFIRSQQKKREQGDNVTGETLYFDDEFNTLRNLHKESYSLTNYGQMPDDRWIGKASVFYPEMTEEEKKMLQAIEPKKKNSSSRTPRKKPSQKDKNVLDLDDQSSPKSEKTTDLTDGAAGDGAVLIPVP